MLRKRERLSATEEEPIAALDHLRAERHETKMRALEEMDDLLLAISHEIYTPHLKKWLFFIHHDRDSTGRLGNDDKTSSNDIGPFSGIQALHKPRSMENLAPPSIANKEISQVRAKLRSVKRTTTSRPTSAGGKDVKSGPAGHNELAGPLVERAKTTAGGEFDKNADCPSLMSSTDPSTTPQQSFRRNRRAKAALKAIPPHLQSTSPHRREITEESFKPSRGTDADLMDYIEC